VLRTTVGAGKKSLEMMRKFTQLNRTLHPKKGFVGTKVLLACMENRSEGMQEEVISYDPEKKKPALEQRRAEKLGGIQRVTGTVRHVQTVQFVGRKLKKWRGKPSA